ncbi:MAG TPA: hypothetical protein VF126_10795 [Acidobacteriaceae bacterium]
MMSRSVVCLFVSKAGRYLPALFLGFTVAACGAWAQEPASTQYSSSSNDASPQNPSVLSFHAQESGQNSGGYGQGGYKQYPRYGEPGFHRLAIEAGAGFSSPIGNTKGTQTTGYNIRLGGGWNFSQHFGLLAAWEFHDTGIPNSVLAASGAPDGNVHLWGITLDPVFYYKTSGAWGGYVTGGGGFYRKLTSFTAPVFLGIGCDFYGYCYPQYANVLLSHFSSNQGGANIGLGFTHNISDRGAKVFAEARYLFVNSPKPSPTQFGSGTVSMIPVTFGIRF